MAQERTVVRVSSTKEGRYAQRIEARDHELTADEPAPSGRDLGPTPYELLVAALGACTSMTIRMYADRKGFALDDVAVHLTYERVHVEDCEGCEDGRHRVHRFERTITLTGDLSDEERGRLLEIAERCPVHRTLTEQKQIVSTLTP